MPISLDTVLSAYKQRIPMVKTNTVTTVAGVPFTTIDRSGFPVAGSLNPSSTANGTVPTDATAGFPAIDNAGGSDSIYLTQVAISSSVACSVEIFDVLFWAGQTTIPTSGTTTISLTSRPSFTGRVPFLRDGVTRDWAQVQLFIQMSVAGSAHAHTTSIDYLDQGGAAGNTGNQVTNAMIVNRLIRCPLAAGDTGVQEITGYNVNGATSSTGAVSALAMRSLGRFRTQGGLSSLYGPDYTGMPVVYNDSALLMVVYADSTSSGIPQVDLTLSHINPA
jgi:hypothetical protein